jgi:hypothetical protein
MMKADATSPHWEPINAGKVADGELLPFRTARSRKCSTQSRQTETHDHDNDARDEFLDSPKRSRRIDTSAFRDHNYVYVTPTEVGQARRVTVRQRVEAN